jgi:hypothetical protein
MMRWLAVAAISFAAVFMMADAPTGVLSLTATTANVAGAPDNVRIEVLRWSTGQERERLLSAWDLKAGASGSSGTPATSGGPAAGRGAGKGLGKQGRGGAKGAEPSPAATPITPETALTNALEEAPTVGYLWSSEAVGYALRYAGKIENPDASQRIILITQRKLGAGNQLWRPVPDAPSNNYEFSVIELRLNQKEEGEGKASLTGKIAEDGAAKMVTLENYNVLPAVFRNVRKRTGQ